VFAFPDPSLTVIDESKTRFGADVLHGTQIARTVLAVILQPIPLWNQNIFMEGFYYE